MGGCDGRGGRGGCMSAKNIYNQSLDQNLANHVALSPLSFFRRAAQVYPNHPAVIHGALKRSWGEVYARCVRLADALRGRGIKAGATVAALCANTPAMFELHFAVAMAGGVLNAINTRLDAPVVAYILEHGEAKILIVDPEFHEVAKAAVQSIKAEVLVVDALDESQGWDQRFGPLTYEALLEEGTAGAPWALPQDEWDAITLNYTSGTTGRPKGVVFHHRGAYLNAVSNALVWEMTNHPVYLWTLPMFHCNGWCFPWTLAINAGTSICLRKVVADDIFAAFATHQVSHFCGAPIVLNTLLNADPALHQTMTHKVKAMTAGAPPPAAVLQGMAAIGIEVTHTYGLTETYGPVTLCAEQDGWAQLSADEQANIKARQGVAGHMLEGLMVADPETLEPVPADGKTLGEVFMRGNNVMKGYLKNPKSTRESFQGGWFHSGDLAVVHPDGYIQIRDRSKDLIISGGENISSVEVEDVLYRHPKVLEAAVVARSHKKWGEAPCAFVTLVPEASETEESIVRYCRENMAVFKIPKTVVFGELPKTSTGKVQKFILRERAENLTQKPRA